MPIACPFFTALASPHCRDDRRLDSAPKRPYLEVMTQALEPPPSLRFRRALLDIMAPLAGERGWTDLVLKEAAAVAGLSEGERDLAAPRGVIDMIDAFAARADEDMLEALTQENLLRMRVRERVRAAVLARLRALEPFKAAEGKAIQALARPLRAQEGPRIVWRTADQIWRALGDRSTDENYYSKRAILSGVLASTTLRWLGDDTDDWTATKDFLERRIENVMQFEKLKAQAGPAIAMAGFAMGRAADFVGRRGK
jgi:ubiquinone biosynthesis protein COQ9